jgi:hypothetical protein
MVLFSCPAKTVTLGGGIQLDVTYELRGGTEGCVLVQVVPQGLPDVSTQASLAGQPRAGKLSFGINQELADGGGLWPQQLSSIIASLHDATCNDPIVAQVSLDNARAMFPDGTIRIESVVLIEPETDGGAAGGGAGGSGGAAGGGSAGGTATGGGAAGGTAMGGGAAGGSAMGGGAAGGGSASCSFVPFAAPITGTVKDLAVFDVGALWIAGEGPAKLATRMPGGGFVAGSCTAPSSFDAVWARSDGTAYFGVGNSGVLYSSTPAGAACIMVASDINTSGKVTAISGGTAKIFVGNDNGHVTRDDVVNQNSADDQPLQAIEDIYAFTDTDVYAVGISTTSGSKGGIVHFDGSNWTELISPGGQSELNAVSFVNSSLGFAAGQVVYRFDGATWTLTSIGLPSGCSVITGLAAISATSVYAVCGDSHVYHHDGTGWMTVATKVGSNFSRIRGTSECDLWAVGTAGGLLTTNR